MALKKPLVLNGGQLQRLQTGDTLDPTGLFDSATNLGGLSGLATNGITVHNGTGFTTVSLTAPAAGMTITNPDGIGGSPTFAFSGELSALLALGTGIVAKDATGSLAARTIQGTTDQIAVANGSGVAGNPTVSLASNPVLPGTASVTVPAGTTAQQPVAPTVGMMRYNTTAGKFEFYEGAAWVQYGTSNTSGTVTSVDVALPTSVFSASSGAITSAGTISFTLNSQLANTVFAAPDGLAGTPTFRSLVAADIPALSWSKITSGTPTTLAGYGITDGVVNTTQVIAGTGLTGGGALSGNVTISMPNVGTAVTGQFVKITTDAQGRVSGTAAVGSTDITTALGYTPVNKAGDSMSGNLTFTGGATPTGLPTVAVGSTDAVSKAYVDNLVSGGATWRNPITDPDLNDVLAAAPGAPVDGSSYLATAAGTWGTTSVVAGNIVTYTTAGGYVVIDTLTAGQRFIIAGEHGTIGTGLSSLVVGGYALSNGDLIQYTGTGDGSVAGSWTCPEGRSGNAGVGSTEMVQGVTVLCNDPQSLHYGHTYLYDASSNIWHEIAGPGSIGAGVGLAYSGNTLNINLGAGITQLPSDEVGLDVRPSGALILTTDGTTSSTATNAQLSLLLNGSTLTQGVAGLSVAAGGITATELNASVAGAGLSGGGGTALSVNVDNSSLEITVDTLNIKAGGVTAAMLATAVAGAGLVNSGTALDINVGTGALQTTGDVLDIKTGGVTNAMLANSSTTFAGTSGTPTAVSLGGTLTIAAGTGISTTASAGTVTVALNAALNDLTDVTITTPAAGDVIYRNGAGQFVNGAPGATSGVQPYDATLAALAQLTTTSGMIVETGADAFTTRVITGTAGQITVTNGDGIAGDPTIALAASGVTAGTYTSVTVDTYGRVTAGSAIELNTQVAMTNANAGVLTIGTPVYVSVAGSVDKADASTMPQARAIGLVADATINSAASGNIAVSGILVATTGQWDAVKDTGTGGLTAGAAYYISETTGKITVTAPSTTGAYIAPIGIALSTTQLKIQIDPTIML